uniref:hypothetical protein n=1 Tax=Salinispora fenicalii TaxID=1137263 RepID=UPI000486333F
MIATSDPTAERLDGGWMWCVEDRIRCAKDTGLGRLPSRELAINAAWCTTAAIAVDLLAWLQLTGLNGDLAKPNRNNCATGSCTPPPPRARPTPPLAAHPHHLSLGTPETRLHRPTATKRAEPKKPASGANHRG